MTGTLAKVAIAGPFSVRRYTRAGRFRAAGARPLDSTAHRTSWPRSWTATGAPGEAGGGPCWSTTSGAGGAGTLSFLGNKAKRLLGPLALRSTPLPRRTRVALALGLGAVALLVASVVGLVLG